MMVDVGEVQNITCYILIMDGEWVKIAKKINHLCLHGACEKISVNSTL